MDPVPSGARSNSPRAHGLTTLMWPAPAQSTRPWSLLRTAEMDSEREPYLLSSACAPEHPSTSDGGLAETVWPQCRTRRAARQDRAPCTTAAAHAPRPTGELACAAAPPRWPPGDRDTAPLYAAWAHHTTRSSPVRRALLAHRPGYGPLESGSTVPRCWRRQIAPSVARSQSEVSSDCPPCCRSPICTIGHALANAQDHTSQGHTAERRL